MNNNKGYTYNNYDKNKKHNYRDIKESYDNYNQSKNLNKKRRKEQSVVINFVSKEEQEKNKACDDFLNNLENSCKATTFVSKTNNNDNTLKNNSQIEKSNKEDFKLFINNENSLIKIWSDNESINEIIYLCCVESNYNNNPIKEFKILCEINTEELLFSQVESISKNLYDVNNILNLTYSKKKDNFINNIINKNLKNKFIYIITNNIAYSTNNNILTSENSLSNIDIYVLMSISSYYVIESYINISKLEDFTIVKLDYKKDSFYKNIYSNCNQISNSLSVLDNKDNINLNLSNKSINNAYLIKENSDLKEEINHLKNKLIDKELKIKNLEETLKKTEEEMCNKGDNNSSIIQERCNLIIESHIKIFKDEVSSLRSFINELKNINAKINEEFIDIKINESFALNKYINKNNMNFRILKIINFAVMSNIKCNNNYLDVKDINCNNNILYRKNKCIKCNIIDENALISFLGCKHKNICNLCFEKIRISIENENKTFIMCGICNIGVICLI